MEEKLWKFTDEMLDRPGGNPSPDPAMVHILAHDWQKKCKRVKELEEMIARSNE